MSGLRRLRTVLAAHRVGEVAIERPDGRVIDTLLRARITVVVINPNQVKNLRGRYGSTGRKDDRFDAFVLADTLRTDRARLTPGPRQPGHGHGCDDCAAPARTSSPTGSRWRTSCAPTCAPSTWPRSACSPTSTRRSV
ncbi:IS110 family transposase [Rhodococcus ruber]|uniref:IS110 family transposase n=1 Tax=Rhodococcus ruber TaxID=1830 RepID=UPI00034AD230|nr:IS110 family transposase [Rhodococcus ruber]